MLSQALLLLYFKMDNGSNVCGVEFNYNNLEVKKREENEKEKREAEVKNKKGEVKKEKKEAVGEDEEENKKQENVAVEIYSKSIVSANDLDVEMDFNDQLLRKLVLGKFEVQSEEGRSGANPCAFFLHETH